MSLTEAAPAVSDFGRTPPHDLAAERATLGAMLVSRDAIADVRPIIAAGDHWRGAHQIVHETILELDDEGKPADWVTVVNLLRGRQMLERVGGVNVIHDLVQAVPVAVAAAYYARIVRDCATFRRAIEAGTRIVQAAYEGDNDAEALAERARTWVDAIPASAAEDEACPLDDLLLEVIESLEHEEARGLMTPWSDLNMLLNGLAPGEMDVLAARPGTGKSVAGLNIAAHAAIRLGVPSVIFSMEMSRQEIMMRLISSEGRVPLWSLMHRDLTEEYWHRVRRAQQIIMGAPLVIDDTPGCSLAHIRSRLRQMSRTRPAGLAVVDYLQLLTGTGRSENRQTEVSGFSRGLKRIAGEFSVPVLAISQLNRMSAHRSDRTPELSDLRESGAIENDASIVILMHREDTNGQESPRCGEVDFIVAKNRNGPPATVTLAFQGEFARCVGMARDDVPPSEWTPTAVLEHS